MTDSHIESLYQEAKSALKARDYEYAIELLKRILVMDENYKDTSRLLEKAIRLRKLRWYKNPALWGALGLVIIFVLGFTIAPKIGGLFSSSAPTESFSSTATRTAIPTSSPTVTPTHTPSPTPTATRLPSWVTDFAKPILDNIDGHTPNVQENFDLGIPNWLKSENKCLGGYPKIVDGEMVISGSGSACSVQWTMWYTDFVIEMDARMLPVEGSRSPNSRWHFFFRGIQGFDFYYNGSVKGISFGFQPELESYHILIIVQEQANTLYINNQPTYYGSLPSGWKNGIGWWFCADPVAFDNIKIWDLNNIKNSP